MKLMASDMEMGGGSLERLVAILDLFAGIRHPPGQAMDPASLGVADVSRALGLAKGTVSRNLSRLEQVGILQRLPDRRYILGNRVYEWGQAAAPGSDVKRWAHPVMEQLAAEFGETVSLVVRDGNDAVCIDQVDGSFSLRLSAVVGRRLSLHAGSSPRLLLAFAPQGVQETILARGDYPALASATITEPAKLRHVIAETRRLGHALSQNELDEGAVGIAAPIRDSAGTVRAAIGAAGPANRFTGERQDAIIAAVCEAAAAVSRALGYRPRADTSCHAGAAGDNASTVCP
jgi:IclR family transcriptional regulator, KDG regulon repressor